MRRVLERQVAPAVARVAVDRPDEPVERIGLLLARRVGLHLLLGRGGRLGAELDVRVGDVARLPGHDVGRGGAHEQRQHESGHEHDPPPAPLALARGHAGLGYRRVPRRPRPHVQGVHDRAGGARRRAGRLGGRRRGPRRAARAAAARARSRRRGRRRGGGAAGGRARSAARWSPTTASGRRRSARTACCSTSRPRGARPTSGRARSPTCALGATLDEDLARRDFTVNALALRLADGELRGAPGARGRPARRDPARAPRRVVPRRSHAAAPARALRRAAGLRRRPAHVRARRRRARGRGARDGERRAAGRGAAPAGARAAARRAAAAGAPRPRRRPAAGVRPGPGPDPPRAGGRRRAGRARRSRRARRRACAARRRTRSRRGCARSRSPPPTPRRSSPPPTSTPARWRALARPRPTPRWRGSPSRRRSWPRPTARRRRAPGSTTGAARGSAIDGDDLLAAGLSGPGGRARPGRRPGRAARRRRPDPRRPARGRAPGRAVNDTNAARPPDPARRAASMSLYDANAAGARSSRRAVLRSCRGSRWTATPTTTSATPAISCAEGSWPSTTMPITVAVAGSSETSSA